MSSLHTDRARFVAERKGASAVRRERWDYLMGFSKRELAEIVVHLAAACTDSYEEALEGDGVMARVREEVDALKAAGAI